VGLDFRERKGLAGLRAIASRLGGGNRGRKVKVRVMDWWHKIVFPVRRVWVAVAARVKARKNGGGLLKLRDDIQTCGYEDVQVMWEMLSKSDSEITPKRKHRPLWRVFVWSNHSSAAAAASSFSTTHA